VSDEDEDAKFDELLQEITQELIEAMPDGTSESVLRAITELNPFQVMGLAGIDDPLGGPPEVSKDVDQNRPRGWYVYAHKDSAGGIFYIGKGKGRRAWQSSGRSRHLCWHWYVERHLQNKYTVEILHDSLDEEGARSFEDAWMSHLDPDQLINWANCFVRPSAASQNYDAAFLLRNETLAMVKETRETEKANPEAAVEIYLDALKAIDEFAPVICRGTGRTGVVGMVQSEMGKFEVLRGEVEVLDRLTLCLKKLNRGPEAAKYAVEYFAKYQYDAVLSKGIAVQKRVAKLLGRQQPEVYPTQFLDPENELVKFRLKHGDLRPDCVSFSTD